MGIAEIVINVNDIVASKRFYQDVLGLEVALELNREDPPNDHPDAPPTIVYVSSCSGSKPGRTQAGVAQW